MTRSPITMFVQCTLASILILQGLEQRPLDAQQQVLLLSPKDPAAGWSFNNGKEFPGATGSVSSDPNVKRDGRASLKLVGDFTKGGGYVDTGHKLEGIDIRELSFWVRNLESDRFTLRLNDASGQTHQIVIQAEKNADWQQLTLPLEKFFARRGEADAVTSVAKYESWGGAQDSRWHGPAVSLFLLLPNPRDNKAHELWFNDISITPKPAEVPGAEIKSVVVLDEVLEGTHDWRFTLGEEFPGAKGSLTILNNVPAAGQTSFKLAGNFTGGGAYVAAVKTLGDLAAKDVTAVRLKLRTDNTESIGVQLVDASGQTHQKKGVKVIADGKWHDVVLKPTEIAGGEHWGGPNDGKWRGPLAQLVISLSAGSDPRQKQPVIELAEIRADALLAVFAQPPAFTGDFEQPELGTDWATTGNITIDAKTAFKGKQSLALTRPLESIDKPCSVTSPRFVLTPGRWDIGLACKSDLHSPDSSYNAVTQLECLDAAGKVLDRITIADVFGKHDWQKLSKRIDIPNGVAFARLQTQLNKTYGSYWIDDLSAVYLAPSPRKDDRIIRVLFATAQLGNLLFPKDSRTVNITIETKKPLRDSQHSMTLVVRDYWGAEQAQPVTVDLGASEKRGDRYHYQASINLDSVSLELGRYYELHAAIPQEGEEPFRNYTSLAILPEAETKKYKPEEVPFTSRNWDNRLSEYIRLTDRLGIRVCGIWGGWSPKAPFKAEAPGLDLAHELGMGWLSNTPIAQIELGKDDQTDESLRQGVRNLIEQYGKNRPMIINLGNEPHGTGERVLKNVAAYRVVYEEVKKVDPTIPVVATSVEPNEEYFKAGYGQWCDAYDFHIYEDSENVRRTIHEYRDLMKKYGHEKPIWSTELGLNSQGQTRHVVAVEVIKKFATFFSAGGANVSWFGLLYPDGDAKLHGTSGNSHNVFDCRYNRYCPRLDAIAYYNAVNSIAIKKFVAEKTYAEGVQATLFRDRDSRNLQVLWKEKGRQDVFVPLPGIQQVQVIRIDGSRRLLDAAKKGLTLTVSDDPLLLLFEGENFELPAALQSPLTFVHAPLPQVSKGNPISFIVIQKDVPAHQAELVAPPFWKVKSVPEASKNGVTSMRFTLTPPTETSIREVDMTITLKGQQGQSFGELYVRCPIAD